jgi:hypothetical protein
MIFVRTFKGIPNTTIRDALVDVHGTSDRRVQRPRDLTFLAHRPWGCARHTLQIPRATSGRSTPTRGPGPGE